MQESREARRSMRWFGGSGDTELAKQVNGRKKDCIEWSCIMKVLECSLGLEDSLSEGNGDRGELKASE